MNSIRRRLLFWLIAAVLFASVVAALGVYRQARSELDDVFDYHLEQIALSLRDRTFEQIVTEPPVVEDRFDFVIQVWRPDGVRLYYSAPRATLPNSGWLGYANVHTNEGVWRMFTVQNAGRIIQVAQPMSVRNRLAVASALRTMMPFLLLIPLLGVLVWVSVGRELRPLEAVARAVGKRSAAALDPLRETGLPDEVRPLVSELNHLLQRLGRSLAVQREFVADAAHELRTPLTALRLQVQLAERASTEDERAAAFATVKTGLERAAHLVGQLLTLARQDPENSARPMAAVDLAEVARRVVAEHYPLAEAKHLDLGVGRAEAFALTGDEESLRVMIANLVNNAIRYTPAGGRIDVALYPEEDRGILEVVDSGPGIPAAERERAFDRFYRRPGSDGEGSGLGLAIVRNVAERHRASVRLDDAPQGPGLAVRVSFPIG